MLVFASAANRSKKGSIPVPAAKITFLPAKSISSEAPIGPLIKNFAVES